MTMKRRIMKELESVATNPPPGISCWPKRNNLTELEALIEGAQDTPYSGGHFKLDITIPEAYPNEPPKIRFVTQVYHPNIDSGGRICLDTLVMPPKGFWKPSLSIEKVLLTLQALLSHPNPDDPLVPEISNEFKENYKQFEAKARACTQRYAQPDTSKIVPTTSSTTTTTTCTSTTDVPNSVTSKLSGTPSHSLPNKQAKKKTDHSDSDSDSDSPEEETVQPQISQKKEPDANQKIESKQINKQAKKKTDHSNSDLDSDSAVLTEQAVQPKIISRKIEPQANKKTKPKESENMAPRVSSKNSKSLKLLQLKESRKEQKPEEDSSSESIDIFSEEISISKKDQKPKKPTKLKRKPEAQPEPPAKKRKLSSLSLQPRPDNKTDATAVQQKKSKAEPKRDSAHEPPPKKPEVPQRNKTETTAAVAVKSSSVTKPVTKKRLNLSLSSKETT